MNRKISDKKLDKLLSGNESYYLPTEEDQSRNVVFNDFAFHMLLSTATYLRNLAMMHSDFINYNYKSPNKPLNLEALKSAMDACKESLAKNETEIRPFSIYQTRVDLLKKELLWIKKYGLFEEDKVFLAFINDAYNQISSNLRDAQLFIRIFHLVCNHETLVMYEMN